MEPSGREVFGFEMQKQEPIDDKRGASSARDVAEDKIVSNLAEALTRLHNELDRVELWTAALSCFVRPVPDYQPGNEFLLPTVRPAARKEPRDKS